MRVSETSSHGTCTYVKLLLGAALFWSLPSGQPWADESPQNATIQTTVAPSEKEQSTASPNVAQRAATVAYLRGLQRPEGGFAAAENAPATLPATSSALRAMKYFGGKIPDESQCKKFVAQCRAPDGQGYAPTPGGKVEVFISAVGWMAAVELKTNDQTHDQALADYLGANVHSFEEARIAAAAVESAQYQHPSAARWRAIIERERQPDGTFGHGAGSARLTASALVTLLRLNGKAEPREQMLDVLRAGQTPTGGWSKANQPPDLETTYRVMRAFWMLRAKPNIPLCRAFIAQCRQPNGSYSLAPGQTGNVGATYFAGIILHWLDQLEKMPKS